MIKARVAGTGPIMVPNAITKMGDTLKDQFLDLRGLAAYSSLGVSSLRGHIRSNHLPAYQVHGKILIRKSEFDQWLSQFRVNRTQDLNRLADEIMGEIGSGSRRS